MLRAADPVEFYGESRTCYRCGATILGRRRRVCVRCKKPRGRPRRPPGQPGQALSFRERQVVALVTQGKLNKEIAHELGLTEGTVKEYMNRIFRKVGVTNRTLLAIRYFPYYGGAEHGG